MKMDFASDIRDKQLQARAEEEFSPYQGMSVEEQDAEYRRQLISYEAKKRDFEEHKAKNEALDAAAKVKMEGGTLEEQKATYETTFWKALKEVGEQSAQYEAEAGYEAPTELLNSESLRHRNLPPFDEEAVRQRMGGSYIGHNAVTYTEPLRCNDTQSEWVTSTAPAPLHSSYTKSSEMYTKTTNAARSSSPFAQTPVASSFMPVTTSPTAPASNLGKYVGKPYTNTYTASNQPTNYIASSSKLGQVNWTEPSVNQSAVVQPRLTDISEQKTTSHYSSSPVYTSSPVTYSSAMDTPMPASGTAHLGGLSPLSNTRTQYYSSYNERPTATEVSTYVTTPTSYVPHYTDRGASVHSIPPNEGIVAPPPPPSISSRGGRYNAGTTEYQTTYSQQKVTPTFTTTQHYVTEYPQVNPPAQTHQTAEYSQPIAANMGAFNKEERRVRRIKPAKKRGRGCCSRA